MAETSVILTFGSPTGATVACVFFATLSVFVGFLVHSVTARLSRMKLPPNARPTGVRLGSAAVGVLVALMMFSAIYLTSLAGFYQMELRENHLLLHYILPDRTVVLSRNEMAEAVRVPTYKGQWRLIVYTPSGQEYASAHADYASARKAWEVLSHEWSKSFLR